WITVSVSNPGYPWPPEDGLAGSGDAEITYTVAANTTGANRSATLIIGAQTVTISQASGCLFSGSPAVRILAAGSGCSSLSFVPSNGACGWALTFTQSWITATSSTSGTGSGSVSYSVSANGSNGTRSAWINANGMAIALVLQLGPNGAAGGQSGTSSFTD